jgi:ribosomal protein S18 acetylase RimI-like enzyme
MNSFQIRPYRGLDDIPGMAAANQRLRSRTGVLEPIDIEAMVHRYTHLVNSDPLVDCAIAELDGASAGYVRAEWHDLVDGDRVFDITLILDPTAWGHGIAAGLLDWGERRVREMASSLPSDRTCWYGNWLYEGDTELEGALRERGYSVVRWGAEMLRPDLEAIADVPLAAGYTLRSPEEAELPAVFDMMTAGFREHWGEYVESDQRLDEWVDDPRFRRDLVVVVWLGKAPASCVSNLLSDAPDGSVRGLLESVATHPDHRRRGLAKAAITESLRRLRAAGATSALLGVDTENHNRAVDLYTACGFSIASSTTIWRRPLDTYALKEAE